MEEGGWGQVVPVFVEAVQKFGWTIVLVGFGVILVFWRFDSFRAVFSGINRHHINERKENWEDSQDIIKNLQDELARVRKWRADDNDDFDRQKTMLQAQITDLRGQVTELRADNTVLREQVAAMIRTVESSERGNSRLRHALNNVCSADAYVRRRARAAGLTDVPPFPSDALMELDDEYGDRLREVMKEYC